MAADSECVEVDVVLTDLLLCGHDDISFGDHYLRLFVDRLHDDAVHCRLVVTCDM